MLALLITLFAQDGREQAKKLLDAVAATTKDAPAVSVECEYAKRGHDEIEKLTISLKRPNLARIDYSIEGQNYAILVSDGQTFWYYNRVWNQYLKLTPRIDLLRTNIENSEAGLLAELYYDRSAGTLLNAATEVSVKKDRLKDEDCDLIVWKLGDCLEYRLWIDSKRAMRCLKYYATFRDRGHSVEDDRTLTFGSLDLSPKLADDAFTFTPPKDARLIEQDDLADIPSKECKAGGDADKKYFLVGPKKEIKPPAKGFGLVVILPGGDGSAEFAPFVKRIYANVLAENYLVAQPVAIKWTPDQKIVWPTEKSPVEKMKFSTEEFVESIIDEVAKTEKLDRTRIFTLSWSSSGPAAYAISLRKRKLVTGSFVAMSVFKPDLLPALDAAKEHAFFLYQSPDDKVCRLKFAEDARAALKEKGAKVELKTYEGGHGWHGDVYGDIRAGIEWLEKNHAKPGK